MRSLVRPSIFPLVVSEELAKSDLGEGVKGNNIISSHQPRDRLLIDFIRLRLSYNFQFKGVSFVGCLFIQSIPSYLSLDSATMVLYHREEHKLAVDGNNNVVIDLQVSDLRGS